MAAPPLPPKSSSNSWPTRNNGIVGSNANRNTYPPVAVTSAINSQSHFMTQISNSSVQAVSTAPPLPPRPSIKKWNPGYGNLDILSVVPHASAATFKNTSSNVIQSTETTMNVGGNFSAGVLFSAMNGNLSANFNTMPAGRYPPASANQSFPHNNQTFQKMPALNNSPALCFTNNMYQASFVPYVPQSFDIQHSKSAPDLAVFKSSTVSNFQRFSIPNNNFISTTSSITTQATFSTSSNRNTQANLENVLKFMKKKRDSNLIDLYSGENESLNTNDVRNKKHHIDDILRMFDPLAEVEEPVLPACEEEDNNNIISESSDTFVKTAVVNVSAIPKDDLPSVKSTLTNINEPKADGTVYASIKHPATDVILKVIPRKSAYSPEIYDFCEKLRKLRSEFCFDDHPINAGVVISPTLDSCQESALSIQLIIASNYSQRPVSFTCDVNTSIEHIISHTVCTLIEDTSSLSMDDFILKVHGLSEYFTAHSSLSDYEYVHQCHKFDRPVQLSLINAKDLKRPLARTRRDDVNDVDFKVEDILPLQKKGVISYETLNILIETLEKEIEKIKSNALKYETEHILSPQGVVQAVKAICTLLSHVETVEITDAVSSLIHVSLLFEKSEKPNFDISSELGTFSSSLGTNMKKEELLQNLFQLLELSLQQLQQAIHQLFAMYTKMFHVNFDVPTSENGCTKSVTDFLDTLLLQLCVVHGLPSNECSKFSNYNITCDICYGKNILASIVSKSVTATKSFFPQLLFEEWLQFETLSMCTLPQEATLYLTLWGINPTPTDAKQFENNLPAKISLGWCGIRLFNYKGELLQGNLLIGLWPPDTPKHSGPILSNPNCSSPLIQISLPEFDCIVKFPKVIFNKFASIQKRDFESLDFHTQETLTDIINKDVLSSLKPEEKELLWEKRNYLCEFPQALPKVLSSAHGWDWACLSDIYSLLRSWKPLSPVDSLRLLLPCYPDREVRKVAIQWMKDIVSDELCDYLPQMVQVLRYENWNDSPVAWFLLERSLTSIRVAHYLYWLLKENINDKVVGTRMKLMVNALLMVIGSALRNRVETQEALLNNLSDIADKIKKTKESLRLSVLFHELERTHHNLTDNPTCLALSPSLEVCGIDVKSCSYFTSNTLPLKLSFHNMESAGKNTEAIYKAGDDLRQDMITLQMIRIMDKLWLKEGLDLKIVTFMCVATEFRKGMVEMVPEAETLRKIQTELGLTGSFKDRSISEWLQKYNTSELEYQQAVDNFTLSCAGYCVATYILGICDRHNDNIMLKTSGHIFHIDFGKFLGDAQMLGSIKRDRTPFVLTSDMAYVINGGDKPSKKFQYFIDLCCQAFNIIRQHSNIFFNLFTLMVSSGIPGLSLDAVEYIRKALLPELSEAEATARFTHMIQDSLKSWFTQFNFFIHNLAQLRFTGDHNDDLLLSFIPKTFNKDADGKILLASVIGCKKMYDPEKYYIYIVKVERQNQPVSSCIFRTYREFIEFHQKLCMMFPLAKFHPLPGNPLMGRTNIRDVADRRRQELQTFIQKLFTSAEEISHCDLVYTFFHPLLRDQEGMAEAREAKAAMMRARRGSSVGNVHGQIKLSIVHKNGCLFIMVMHAKNLCSSKGTAPDPYVKTYLLPDPNKLTKRKTKIVSKNCHPTFMEMLVYDLPLEVVRHRKLFVSVWNYDRVQENEFLGSVALPLTDGPLNKERIQWYQLGTFNL